MRTGSTSRPWARRPPWSRRARGRRAGIPPRRRRWSWRSPRGSGSAGARACSPRRSAVSAERAARRGARRPQSGASGCPAVSRSSRPGRSWGTDRRRPCRTSSPAHPWAAAARRRWGRSRTTPPTSSLELLLSYRYVCLSVPPRRRSGCPTNLAGPDASPAAVPGVPVEPRGNLRSGVDGGYTCRDVVCGGSTFKKSDKTLTGLSVTD